MNIKAVIFDLDGTVVKFALDFVRARKEAIAEMGRRDIDVKDLSESLSLYSMLKIVKGRLDAEAFSNLEKFLWDILEKIELRAADETDLQPDALQTLISIKNLGLRMAIVTNNGRKATNMVAKKFGLNDFFDVVVTREGAKELKPDGGSIERALEILGINSSEAIYVGDGVIDILAAEKAKVISVAIPTGVSRIDDLVKAKPDYVIGSLKDIKRLIESIGQ
ncbi:MAG: HAD family hydrolase [Nitrososphaerales archaeon]|nr:HAD family hydrolase [Nitrososphaerales archaeon]